MFMPKMKKMDLVVFPYRGSDGQTDGRTDRRSPFLYPRNARRGDNYMVSNSVISKYLHKKNLPK